ncbi:MAG: hypothetical protein AAF993_11805 [Pseudomonadota bacterium]
MHFKHQSRLILFAVSIVVVVGGLVFSLSGTPRNSLSIVGKTSEALSAQPIDTTFENTADDSTQPASQNLPSVPLLFAEDLYSQQVVERLLAAGADLAELRNIAALEVVLNEQDVACFAHDSAAKRFLCRWDGLRQPGPQRHPYYSYDLQALKAMSHGDGVAAFVYADRMLLEDWKESLDFSIRSTALTGKVGPLLKARSIIMMPVIMQYKEDCAAALAAADTNMISALALDALAADKGIPNDHYQPLDAALLNDAPALVKQVFDEKRENLGNVLSVMQAEIGIN